MLIERNISLHLQGPEVELFETLLQLAEGSLAIGHNLTSGKITELCARLGIANRGEMHRYLDFCQDILKEMGSEPLYPKVDI